MDAEVHFFLGSALAQSPEKARAMIHLNRSLELMAPDPKVVSRIYAEKGYIRRLQEKYEEAYTLYRSSWEADSTNPIALYYMASILDNSMHRSADALADYQHFIRQLDSQPAASRSQGQIPTIREIVEDRIIAIQEELFFLDQD
jgi:tetratricopeptide (TPR) repeat protein